MSEEGKPAEESRSEVIRVSSQFLGHGMTFAVSVALFGWVGFEVGRRTGTESLLTILGILFGGAIGGYHLVVQVMRRPRAEQGHEGSDEL